MEEQNDVIVPVVIPKFKGRPTNVVARQIKINKEAQAILDIEEKRKQAQAILQDREEKLNRFVEEFVRNGGNATQAALKVFPGTTLANASVKGHYYLNQARDVIRLYMEERGASYGKLIDSAIKKNEESKTPEWFDRLMKIAGYHDFMAKPAAGTANIVNIVNAQRDLAKSYIEGEIVEEDGDKEDQL